MCSTEENEKGIGRMETPWVECVNSPSSHDKPKTFLKHGLDSPCSESNLQNFRLLDLMRGKGICQQQLGVQGFLGRGKTIRQLCFVGQRPKEQSQGGDIIALLPCLFGQVDCLLVGNMLHVDVA